jgi:hypothetical protein
MLENLQSVSLLTIVEIVGPMLLALALLYGIIQTRRRSRRSEIAGQQATRRLYREGAERESRGAE